MIDVWFQYNPVRSRLSNITPPLPVKKEAEITRADGAAVGNVGRSGHRDVIDRGFVIPICASDVIGKIYVKVTSLKYLRQNDVIDIMT